MAMSSPAEAIGGALGLNGARLSPNLEAIISSPVMDKAISYAATKDRLGPNPIVKYLSEQVEHGVWHVDNWAWGPSKPFRWRKTEFHPNLKYVSLKKLPGAAKDYMMYLATIGLDIPYHFRSVLFGRDDFGMGPASPPWSELNRWQKIKISLEALTELPGYVSKVRHKIIFDSRKMKATTRARTYLRQMSQTKIVPHAFNETRKESMRFLKSFDEIIITGLDNVLDNGKSTAEVLREGRNMITENHPSLVQLPLNFFIFEQIGMDNVITIAGNNLITGMKDKRYAGKLDKLLRNSGVLFIERNMRGSKSYLYNQSLAEFAGYELEVMLNNVFKYSNGGREKLTNEPNSANALTLAAKKAKYLVVAAYSFEKIMDDCVLAFVDSKTEPGTFEDLLEMESTGNGKVYVNFGAPISTAPYFEGLSSVDDPKEYEKMLNTIKKRIDADVSDSLKRLTTFTSTYVLAAAVRQSKTNKFHLEDVLGNAQQIINYAQENEFYLPSELKTEAAVLPEMHRAADILVERGALNRTGENFTIASHQEPLLKFYAAKIEPTLALAKK